MAWTPKYHVAGFRRGPQTTVWETMHYSALQYRPHLVYFITLVLITISCNLTEGEFSSAENVFLQDSQFFLYSRAWVAQKKGHLRETRRCRYIAGLKL